MARKQNRADQQGHSQQPYDNALKGLMDDHAAEIIPEFVPDTIVVIEQSNEIRRENIRADLVYLVQHKGELHVLNMELQTDRDSDMAARMLRYHVDLHLAYRLPVISVVLYLFQTSVVESPYKEMSGDEELLSCKYRVIRLWTLDAGEYVRRHAIRMYAVLPGMKGANAALLTQAIEEMKEHYTPSQFARHLARFRTILHRTGTVTEDDKQIVEEYMQVYDSLLDQDPYLQRLAERKAEQKAQKKIQQLEKKAQQEIQQKVVEGELRVLRQMAIEAIEEQFPSLKAFAQEKILSITHPDVLQQLVKQIYKAPDESAIRWLLSTF